MLSTASIRADDATCGKASDRHAASGSALSLLALDDARDLELALRGGLPIATLDAELTKAALKPA